MPPLVPVDKILPKTVAVPGYNHFLTPLRKLVIDYDPLGPTQGGVREYLTKSLFKTARENPDVEFVVRQLRPHKAAVLRGHYINGREKVICVRRMTAHEVEIKMQQLINSSGAKLKHLKNIQLEAAPGGESARGIWSALHDASKAGGGYRI